MSKFRNSNLAFVIYMFIAAFAVVILLVFLTQLWLNRYTRHGDEVRVPDICGMYVEEAQLYLKQQGLSLQIIDSTYSRSVALGTIVEQNPPKDAITKNGRKVYAVMNARMERLVPLPDLHDMSYRQAVASLHSLGMEVDEVEYQPSEFGGLVLDVHYNGETIEAGTKLREGTHLTLVVGKGSDNAATVYVPSLIGKTLTEARQELLRNALVVGAVNYDEPIDGSDEDDKSANDDLFFVYYQEPAAAEWVSEGSRVTLYLSKNKDKKMEAPTEEEEEEFF